MFRIFESARSHVAPVAEGVLRRSRRTQARDIAHKAVLEEHTLFRADFYLEQLHVLGKSSDGISPALHYIMQGDALRLNPHPLFDNHFYHEANPDIEGSGMSALYHFIIHGASEGRWPHPAFDLNLVRSQVGDAADPLSLYVSAPPGTIRPHHRFDEKHVLAQVADELRPRETVLEGFFRAPLTVTPSSDFDSSDYLERYPDIRDLHPFYHYVRWGAAEGRVAHGRTTSLRGVASAIEEAARLDPAVMPPHTDCATLPRIQRLKNPSAAEAVLAELVGSVDMSSRTFVYFVNNLQIGGAERVLANFLQAQADDEEIEQVVVILTQPGAQDSRAWINGVRCRIIDVSELSPTVDVVATFLQMLNVSGLCVINSALGWQLIETHGRALRPLFTLSACTFCYDYDRYGRRGGYAWTDLLFAIDQLDYVVTDNSTFVETLRTDLRLSERNFEKLLVVYQPAPRIAGPAGCSHARADAGLSRPAVLWASRLARQKRLNLALEIAYLLPELEFLIAGQRTEGPDCHQAETPANVRFLGDFTRFADLPIADCSMFLYTAAWDGLPNVLLEAAGAGMPIVAADIGGVAELVNDETGWLVREHGEPAAYARALRDVLADKSVAASRTYRMSALLSQRHDGSGLAETLRVLRRPAAPIARGTP